MDSELGLTLAEGGFHLTFSVLNRLSSKDSFGKATFAATKLWISILDRIGRFFSGEIPAICALGLLVGMPVQS